MDRELSNKLFGVAVVALGLAGLYFKVEYSGWILFLGAMVVVNAIE